MLIAKRLWLLPLAAAPLVLSAPAIAQPLPNWCHQAKTSWPGGCGGPAHKIDKEKEAKSAKVQVGTSKTIDPKQVPAGAVLTKDSSLAKKPGVQVDPTNPNAEGMKESKGIKESGKAAAGFHWDSNAAPGGTTAVPQVQNPGLLDPVPHLNPGAGRAGPFPRN